MNQLTPLEFRTWQEDEKDYLLIDVRESWEHEIFNIGGLLIPVGEVLQRKNEIPRDKPVVFYCEKGIRSMIVIQRLEEAGYSNLYNLDGGMKKWKQFY